MELSDLPGVKEVSADLESKKVEVVFDLPATEEEIIETLKSIDYPPEI
jgi:copper chaperone CopZ